MSISQARGTSRYIVGPVIRFDQGNEVFKRARWDPSLKNEAEKFYGTVYPRSKKGYQLKDLALRDAAWYIEDAFGHGCRIHNQGLLSWETLTKEITCIPADLRFDTNNHQAMSQDVKLVATLLGASLVGITELNRLWIYSHTYNALTHEHKEFELPDEYRYAIVLAFQMDYNLVRTSPTWLAQATEGVEYSRMPSTASMLAQFIRNLGYKAIPSANDTAISIPLAIDAGLGELGRNGLLITKEFGPRVRIAKIFTNLPLKSDDPMDFGVIQFCSICNKCADNCPGKAIISNQRSLKPHNISNAENQLKWPVNAERCFSFWAKNEGSCMNCIRSCPFNKPRGRIHDLVRWLIKRFWWLDLTLVKIDDLLGYDKQVSSDYWSED
jgi:reductive dehalogenase